MSRSGNYYARNRRDTKTKQPISAPPPAPVQTTDKTQDQDRPAASGPVRRVGQPATGERWRHHDRADHLPPGVVRPRGRAQEPVKPNLQPGRLEHGHLGHPIRPRHATMTTRAATMASAISNRMRQIRDRSHPATRDRSASRVASRIYATATVVYLDDHTFTAKFPTSRCSSSNLAGPPSPAAAPRPTPWRAHTGYRPTRRPSSPTPAITTPCGQSASELRPAPPQAETDPRRS